MVDKTKDSSKSSDLSELSNDQPDSRKSMETIQVRGEQTLKVLEFFVYHERTFTISQVASVLGIPYEGARSALRRLSRKALVAHFGSEYVMFDKRREVARKVLAAQGKRVSIDTGNPIGGSLDDISCREVLQETKTKTRLIEVILKPWRSLIGFDKGWRESPWVTRVYLDPWIIQQIRAAMPPQKPSRHDAKWLTLSTEDFTLQVSKVKALKIRPKSPDWRIGLSEFLKNVDGLQDSHQDLIWQKICERAGEMVATDEYYLTDPELSAANRIYSAEVDEGDGSPKMTMKLGVRSHGAGPEAEFGGRIRDLDNVYINLAGQFAASAHYDRKFERIVAEISDRFERKFNEVKMHSREREKELEQEFEEYKKQLKKEYEDRLKKELKSRSQEGSADEPSYIG